ncbi:unnamed protein product [Blepharisma stoltei]|uniref:Uncharacterized protein n=1 Tax=Blepharisma stoltei TaxID=1481888 RepID=A0AAU9JDV5_9CILI|nr:unnamed protein product [Blepharisma stoltei]
MGDTRKRKISLCLLSPNPLKQSSCIDPNRKVNPFNENRLPKLKLNYHEHKEEDFLLKEINSILNKPIISLPPITKKSGSSDPFQKITEKCPKRLKTNPMVSDEEFQRIESVLSTSASSDSSSFSA